MSEINHQIGARTSLSNAYRALTDASGLSSWWSTAKGTSEKGAIIEFIFGKSSSKMEVVELEENKFVKWKVVEGAPDWLGKEISFKLQEDEGQVFVNFRHAGWKVPGSEIGIYSMIWASFMLSLKDYLDTATGRPFPRNIQVNHH